MKRKLNLIDSSRINRLSVLIPVMIAYFLFLPAAFSQENPNTDKPQQDSILYYISPMEYAFMMHEETKWMMKAGFHLSSKDVSFFPVKVAFERRISRSFTVNASIDHDFPLPPAESDGIFPIRISLESRWYYRQNKRLHQERLARNMSDNYFALGMDYSQDLNDMEWNSETWDDQYFSVYLKWGLQRRYLKHGYTDIGITAGLMDDFKDSFNPFFVLNTYVDMGLCFTKDKYKLDRDKYCAFVKCYEADRFIIKTNLVDLVNIGALKNYSWINFSPQFAFEKKIASSAFSINAEINTMVGYSKYFTDAWHYSTYYLAGLDLEGRWYYNLLKNIRNGNAGNSLSANYISAGAGYNFVEDDNNILLTETGPQVHLATGWQRLLSKHLYFDIQVGYDYLFKPYRSGEVFRPRIKLALGYRF
jgi:hypothetical protein